MTWHRLLRFFCVLAAAVPGAAQIIEGNIDRVGFPAATSAGFVIRQGQWFPIMASLRTPGTVPFQGDLRCETLDLDGDRVSFAVGPVALTPGAGMKRVWCYATSQKTTKPDGSLFTLDVIDSNGATLGKLPLQNFELLDNDTQLILDLSEPQLVHLRGLHPAWSPTLDADQQRPYYRSICTSAIPPAEVPDRWFGLEAVNVIVWNRPDPTAMSKDQLDALITWVKNGGQLVVGVADRWAAIAGSPLAEIMPVEGSGTTVASESLPVFSRRLALPADADKPRALSQPIAVTTVRARPDAVVVMRDAAHSGETIDLVVMRCVGSGRVTSTAGDLRAMLSAGIDSKKLLEMMLDITPLREEYRKNETQSPWIGGAIQSVEWPLYDDLAHLINFREETRFLSTALFAFVVVYIAAACGSYLYLQRRKRATLSWSVFAGFAVVGSAISLGAVAGGRGVYGGARQLSFVDMELGAPEVRGLSLLGYSSRTLELVDLTLPGDVSFIRPLSPAPVATTAEYATPQRYACRPAEGRLVDVPLRATLKQFEGIWSMPGEAGNALQGRLTVDRNTGRLTPESWLLNGSKTNFGQGYLLYIDPRIPGEVPHQAAGAIRPWFDATKTVPPSFNVVLVPLPPLPAGGQMREIGRELYARLEANALDPNRSGEMEKHRLPTLYAAQMDWVHRGDELPRGFPSLPARGALLASLRNIALINRMDGGFDSFYRRLSTDRLPERDVSHWLLRGQAVLLLPAANAGPARVERDGAPLQATGISFYRVRCPLEYTGNPPVPPPAESKEEQK